MCWTSYNTPIRKTATEDITCYKLFARESIVWKKTKFWFDSIEKIDSLCMSYEYIPHKANPKVILIICKHTLWKGAYRWYIEKGYHSYETLHKAKLEKNPNLEDVIVECIIPIGSEYYINENQEIVSSNIIVTDKIVR